MKRILLSGIILLSLQITGCGSSPEALEREYKRTCFGDSTIKCKHKLLDWQEARMNSFLKQAKADKEKIIQSKGQPEYERLIAHFESELRLINAERPGWFASTFFSDAHVQ